VTVIQSVGGVAGLFIRRDGVPRYVPLVMCDHVTGEITAGAIMAALIRHERTGEGGAIEVPTQDAIAAFVLKEPTPTFPPHPATHLNRWSTIRICKRSGCCMTNGTIWKARSASSARPSCRTACRRSRAILRARSATTPALCRARRVTTPRRSRR
jgi:hypothetical protein